MPSSKRRRIAVQVAALCALAAIPAVLAPVFGWQWMGVGAWLLCIFNGALLIELLRRQRSSEGRANDRANAASAAMRNGARQAAHLASLLAALQPRAPLPELGGVAATPDFLALVADHILRLRPARMLEFGSGVTTLIAGYALARVGGKLISIEADEKYAAETRSRVAAHGLSDVVEVRHAPPQPLEIDGGSYQWYSPAAYAGEQGLALILVDGPYLMRDRYPALDAAMRIGGSPCVVLCDDARWPEFGAIVERWKTQLPQWRYEFIETEKGTAVFSR